MKLEIELDDRLVHAARTLVSPRGAFAVALLGLATASVVTAAPLREVSYEFFEGDLISASEINENFSDVVGAVDAVDEAVTAMGVRLDDVDFVTDDLDDRVTDLEALSATTLRIVQTGFNDGSISCDQACSATGSGFCLGGSSNGQYISCSTVPGGERRTTPCYCAAP